jgi:phosphoribosylformylglycinamidine cyclo-ligase
VGAEAMYNTFNMGIGFVLLVPPQQAEQVITHFQSQDISANIIGEVVTGVSELVGLL